MDSAKKNLVYMAGQLQQLTEGELQIQGILEDIGKQQPIQSQPRLSAQVLTQLQQLATRMRRQLAKLRDALKLTQLALEKTEPSPKDSLRPASESNKTIQKSSSRPHVRLQRKRFYGFFPEKIKREVVSAVFSGKTIKEVSSYYDICYKNIERWMSHGVKRKHSMRPKRNHQLQHQLNRWIREVSQDQRITTQELQRKALELNRDNDFKASMGWARQYIKRWNLGGVVVRPNNL